MNGRGMITPRIMDLVAHVAHLLYIRNLIPDMGEVNEELERAVNEMRKELAAAKKRAA